MTDAQLQTLREQGMDMHDPLRFHYLEVLARRLATQDGAVRAQLQSRWDAAVARHLADTPPANGPVPPAALPPSPLAQLNDLLASRSPAPESPANTAAPQLAGGLHSVRRFEETWSKVASEQQLLQALAQAPANAGPLNSQRLVLHALRLMRQLSPDYLRRFLASANSLMWLEDTALRLPRARRKTAGGPLRSR